MECQFCKTTTTNPKFCSRSCAAKFNNSKLKKLNKLCLMCLLPTNRKVAKYCSKTCKQLHTTGQRTKLSMTKIGHGPNTYDRIRSNARLLAKNFNFTKCVKCGYSSHIEVCHKKPIAKFPDNALIKEINAKENLMALCPNCHWEFDHGLWFI